MPIPLNLSIIIDALGLSALRQVQGAINDVAVLARFQASQGLRTLATSLQDVTRDSQLVQPGLRQAINAMQALAFQAGSATPANLDILADRFMTQRQAVLDASIVYQQFVGTGENMNVVMRQLAPEVWAVEQALLNTSNTLRGMALGFQVTGRSTVKATEETKKATAALHGYRAAAWKTITATNVLASASSGLMLGFSALRGNMMGVLFGLIFLRFSIIPVTLAVAALAVVVGGLIKLFSSVSSEMQNVMFNAQRLRGELADSITAWRDVATFARVSGRALDDVAAAYAHLQREGALALPVMTAAANLAAAQNIPLEEAVKLITQAVGLKEMDRKALEKLGVNMDKFTGSLTRNNVLLETSAQLTEKHAGAAEDWANRQAGAMGRAKGALESALAVFRAPMMVYVIEPILNALAAFTGHIADLVAELWKTESVQRAFAETVAYVQGVIVSLTKAYEENEELVRWFLRDALETTLFLFRGLIWTGKVLVEVLLSLAGAWRAATVLLKPIWNLLGLVSQALKDIGFGESVSEAKKWSFDFPEIMKTAFATALNSILRGKLDLRVALLSFLGDLLIEMLPFKDELKDTLHRIWDWTVLGGVIGAFFGAPGIGLAIGAGAGIIIELLEEKFGWKINEWFEENLPIIFSAALIGAAIASMIASVPIAIGALAGAIIAALAAWLWPMREEIANWFKNFTDSIIQGLERMAEAVLSWYIEGVGRYLLLPAARAGLAARREEVRAGIEARRVPGYVPLPYRPYVGGGMGVPGGIGFPGGAPVVNVTITGNNIYGQLDEETARIWAQQLGFHTMTRLTSRYGLGATR